MTRTDPYFLPYQRRWIEDQSPLKCMEKSRQIGITYATSYSAVRRASAKNARLDVWVSSRDETQAKLFLEDCKGWARLLQMAATETQELVLDEKEKVTAYVLEFASGRKIYSLSSNPNALAGKRGHVILDEFALHKDQRLLYRIAKPVTMWGGQLEIVSTHRGAATVFNEILRDCRERGNTMGWSVHRVTLDDAVAQGLSERIVAKTGKAESRGEFLARIRAECLDDEQWQQEYCCQPADDATAFLSWEMITGAEMPGALLDFAGLSKCAGPLYLGMDVARKQDLSVIDVGELIGDVLWDRYRIEMKDKRFAEQEDELYRLLALPQMRRGCIDQTGMGAQLAERAGERFGYKVEGVTFTGESKETMAFELRRALEDKRMRIASDPKLRSDLRGIRKETTVAGNIRFAGESEDSHCDRFWALALRLHAAARPGVQAFATVA